MRSALNVLQPRALGLALALALASASSQADCTPAAAALEKLQTMVGAESTARDALATIRRNAQDWKNLLLRGRDEKERQTMQTRFDTQASAYAARLAELRVQLSPLGLGLDRIDVLEREQVQLLAKYRAALAHHGVATLEAAVAADREVQGADVLTFRTLEQTIELLAAGNRAQFQQVRQGLSTCQTPPSISPSLGK